MQNERSVSLRKRVAREAAVLIYTGQEKEYKQAKKRAAKTLRARILPSNIEIAEELDVVTEEKEGSSREKRLVQMRREALQIMETLKDFYPRLVGSVWRGTAHKNSDIDIITFSADAETVLTQLRNDGYTTLKNEWQSVTKRGRKETSFHIHLKLSSGNEAEVVVRGIEKIGQTEKCEIYGDAVTGLTHNQLHKVLLKNPLQRFVP